MAQLVNPAVKTSSINASKNSQAMREQIAKKAYQLYLERGCQDGFDRQDWLNAEAILRFRPSGPSLIL